MQKILMSKYSYFNQSIIIFCLILSVFILPLTSLAATLDELQQQKNAATQKANDLKKQAADKQGNINSIAVLVKKFSSDIASYQSQINTTQKNMTGNEKSIVETENQIQIKQAELEMNMKKQTEAIQAMYVMGRKSTIETLIASESFSEVMARQQYLSALSGKIESMMKDIKQLKADLVTKKTSLVQRSLELDVQKAQLVNFKNTIEFQKNQQSVLLSGAVAEKNQILADAKSAQREVQKISQAELIERRRLAAQFDGVTTIGGSSYANDPDIRVGSDYWGTFDAWGYYTNQCVSYVAWHLNKIQGRTWVRRSGHGDAKNWKDAAGPGTENPSFKVHSSSDTPVVGAVISWTAGSYGHVAIVNKTYSDGTMDISDYNRENDRVYRYTEKARPENIVGGAYVYIY